MLSFCEVDITCTFLALVARETDSADAEGRPNGQIRELGLVVLRGQQIVMICPSDGFEEIENPFADAQ